VEDEGNNNIQGRKEGNGIDSRLLPSLVFIFKKARICLLLKKKRF